jgi:hypothetical protein
MPDDKDDDNEPTYPDSAAALKSLVGPIDLSETRRLLESQGKSDQFFRFFRRPEGDDAA